MSQPRPSERSTATPSKRRKRLIPILLTSATIVSAVLGFVSNVGGARDFICGISSVSDVCAQLHLSRAEAAPNTSLPSVREIEQANKARLLGLIARDWCTEPPLRARHAYRVVGDRIQVNGPNGWQSHSFVRAATETVLVVYVPEPERDRGLWEMTPSADRLSILPPNGGLEQVLDPCD